MAIFSIEKKVLEEHPEVKEAATDLCESVFESDGHIGFIPRPGSLVTLSILLSQKRVIYEVYFDNEQTP